MGESAVRGSHLLQVLVGSSPTLFRAKTPHFCSLALLISGSLPLDQQLNVAALSTVLFFLIPTFPICVRWFPLGDPILDYDKLCPGSYELS
jgi:hypothetical protein